VGGTLEELAHLQKGFETELVVLTVATPEMSGAPPDVALGSCCSAETRAVAEECTLASSVHWTRKDRTGPV
jgi:hypothetical protein